MRNNCCYDWRYDPTARAFVAAAVASAFAGDEYLVFTKKEWIADCGFLFHEKEVYLPRGYDGKQAKISCFRACLKYLDMGYENALARKNEQMMQEYLEEQEKL